MFFCNLYLHRNRHDFQDGLPLIDFNGCAQPSFSEGNEVKNKRLLSEPPVQREGVYTALCPQSVMVIIHKIKQKLLSKVEMRISENKTIKLKFS